ncbi:suppressor of fused domain protein [Lysinibacillus sp. RS5]|uniref:suppressor of fused domain protein n=1 Tax=unclassified Lysinibacillus TaxID=2636778 RepID=UPI0035BE954C
MKKEMNELIGNSEFYQHIRKYLGEPSHINLETLADININLITFKANEERSFHTIITHGMSSISAKVPLDENEWRYTELIMYLPKTWPIMKENIHEFNEYWPFGWLRKLGKFPHEMDTWFCYGDTIPNGDPPELIADNTNFCCMLLLPPIREDESFVELKISKDTSVRFLAVMPIYKEEMDYHLMHGFRALLEKFDQYNVNDIIDINRTNTCKSLNG